jgi:hypothetical protein
LARLRLKTLLDWLREVAVAFLGLANETTTERQLQT